jgi:hypothetical protein
MHMRSAARSVGASLAAPLGGIRQHEQVQSGDQEQGERSTAKRPSEAVYFFCATATMLTMTATVKAMDSQRWVCRTHLFQFNGTSSEDEPEADRSVSIPNCLAYSEFSRCQPPNGAKRELVSMCQLVPDRSKIDEDQRAENY